VLAWNQTAPLPQPADHPAPTTVIVVPTFAELNQIGVFYRFIEWLLDPPERVLRQVAGAARVWVGQPAAAAPDS
jgi:hypothetical protein